MGTNCGNEGFQTLQTLLAEGHTVTTFTGITAIDFSNALEGQDLLYIPELEIGNLAAALSPAAINVISTYINNGRGLIVHGSTSSNPVSFLNTVFGFSISGIATVSGNCPITLNTTMANGTSFSGGPLTLGCYLSATRVLVSSLPASSKCIYEDATLRAVVALMPYGSGKITYMGWDWFEGGPGCAAEDAQWVSAVNNAIAEVTVTPPPIPTMGEWGLIGFSLLLGSLAAGSMFRRKKLAIA